MEVEKRRSSFWFMINRNRNTSGCSGVEEKSGEENYNVVSSHHIHSETNQRKHLGWKPCPSILGNETFERQGSFGITPSFTMYLLTKYNMSQNVQTQLNWAWGFAIPTSSMFFGLFLLSTGTRIYVFVTAEGSVFSSIEQVCVVAYNKWQLQLPPDGVLYKVLYDPPLKKTLVSELQLTSDQFRGDGSFVNLWKLCSIQQVEEVKCLINIAPAWASTIISFLPMQTVTFLVPQAMRMDPHLGPKFEIPAPSINVVAFIVTVIFLPVYACYLVLTLEKIAKQEGWITLLRGIGLGSIFSILAGSQMIPMMENWIVISFSQEGWD